LILTLFFAQVGKFSTPFYTSGTRVSARWLGLNLCSSVKIDLEELLVQVIYFERVKIDAEKGIFEAVLQQ
jgi:hypothetical protein